jgi:hypothetical protein
MLDTHTGIADAYDYYGATLRCKKNKFAHAALVWYSIGPLHGPIV